MLLRVGSDGTLCGLDGFGYAGLGDAQTIGNQFVVPALGTGLTIATPAIAGVISTASWAVPVVGAAAAAVTLAISAILNRRGPKQKLLTTGIVDDLEQQLENNVSAYLQGPRTRASQIVHLQLFDDAWFWLHSAEACGSAELGNPGKACLADRAREGRWPWEVYYRDPIALDATVQDTPASDQAIIDLNNAIAGGAASLGFPPVLSLPGGFEVPWLAVVGLAVILFVAVNS